MKNMIDNKYLILIIFILIYSVTFSRTDSLRTVYEFNSPTPAIWGIVYDGNGFFISDDSLGNIYKIDTTGNILRQYNFPGRVFKGLTFYKNELWVVNDKAIDSIKVDIPWTEEPSDSNLYYIYSIYKVDTLNRILSDSIRFQLSSSATLRTSIIWGIGVYESKLYVSYNGGWGPCTIEFDPLEHKKITELCCAHPSGFTEIDGKLWCVRNNSFDGSGTGNSICDMRFFYWGNSSDKGLSEDHYYELSYYASDLTYDGKNIWVCDHTNKKIKKLSEMITDVKETANEIPFVFFLKQNYPNPFNPSTTISYAIPGGVETWHATSLRIYDVLGREVATLVNEAKPAGNYSVTFNVETLHGASLPSGIYFYQLRAGDYAETKKMMLIK
jgi:hypothetical protein